MDFYNGLPRSFSSFVCRCDAVILAWTTQINGRVVSGNFYDQRSAMYTLNGKHCKICYGIFAESLGHVCHWGGTLTQNGYAIKIWAQSTHPGNITIVANSLPKVVPLTMFWLARIFVPPADRLASWPNTLKWQPETGAKTTRVRKRAYASAAVDKDMQITGQKVAWTSCSPRGKTSHHR